MMHLAVEVKNLGKSYARYRADRPVTWREAALAGFRGIRAVETNWSLQGVSFSLRPGQMLGVIGKNGAGKSTLLNVLGAIIPATCGKVGVNGSVRGLLELGAGFQGDLSGRENVFLSGIVAGLRRQDVARRVEEIVEFAELQGFIDRPVRTYSTGMQMRLAFSVAVHTNPEVLLVDEFLSVGDLAFQAKCLQRIRDLRDSGCAIVFVSHNLEHVREMCDQALWLRAGHVAGLGQPEQLTDLYSAEMRAETLRRAPSGGRAGRRTRERALRLHDNRFGSLEGEIREVVLEPGEEIAPGDPLTVKIGYKFARPLRSPLFSLTISRKDGQICFDTNTLAAGVPTPVMQGEGTVELHLGRLDLAGGEYFVDVGVHECDWKYTYDYHWHAYPLFVRAQASSKAVMQPPSRWVLPLTAGAGGNPFNGGKKNVV